MTKRFRFHVCECKTCSDLVRSVKKSDECERCELKRLRNENPDLKARLKAVRRLYRAPKDVNDQTPRERAFSRVTDLRRKNWRKT